MNRRAYVRRFLLTCVIVLLLALAWGALSGGLRQIPRSSTVGQQVETAVQLVSGLLTVMTVLGCFWWRAWAGPIRGAWVVSLVLAAGLSALVWGPPMPLVALAFAAVAGIVALGTLWALRRLCPGDIEVARGPS